MKAVTSARLSVGYHFLEPGTISRLVAACRCEAGASSTGSRCIGLVYVAIFVIVNLGRRTPALRVKGEHSAGVKESSIGSLFPCCAALCYILGQLGVMSLGTNIKAAAPRRRVNWPVLAVSHDRM